MESSVLLPIVSKLAPKLVVDDKGNVRWEESSEFRYYEADSNSNSNSVVAHDLSPRQLHQPAIQAPLMYLTNGETQVKLEVRAPQGQNFFSVQNLLDAVLEFERINRPLTENWNGDIDQSHVFFEGLEQLSSSLSSDHQPPTPTFEISWGS